MNKIEELKKLLIVVDMVNGFIKEGNMADKDIMKIVPKIEHLIKSTLNEEESMIAFIKDTHEEGCSEFEKFPVHCLKETSESELIDEFKPYEKSSLVYEKNSTSTIFAKNFLRDIDEMKKLKEVIICGCCTDICVLNLAVPLSNYFDENNRRVNIVIDPETVETFNSPAHSRDEYNAMSFKLMRQAGIKVERR